MNKQFVPLVLLSLCILSTMFTNKSKTAGDEQLKEDENLRLIQREEEGEVSDGISPEPWGR